MMLRIPRDDTDPKAPEMKKVSEVFYRYHDRRDVTHFNEDYPCYAFAFLMERYQGSAKDFDPDTHADKLFRLGFTGFSKGIMYQNPHGASRTGRDD